MSILGDTISPWLVVVILMTAGGTAGTSVLYQDSAQNIRNQNDALRAENAELQDQLNETTAELDDKERRVTELTEKLETRTRDIESVVSELKRLEEELNVTRAQLDESEAADSDETIDQLERRLELLCSVEVNQASSACDGFAEDR